MEVFLKSKHYNLSLWLIVVLVFLFALYKFSQFLNVLRILSKIPGPKGYPLLGNMELAVLKPDKLFYTLADYGKTYHPIFTLRIGYSPLVVLSSPEDIEMVVSQMKHLEKGTPYKPMQAWLREGLLLSKGVKWQHRRKLLTPTFHFTILRQFTTIFINESNKLVKDIKKISSEPVDVFSTIANFTLQSICETAMGAKLEEYKTGEKYKDAIYETGDLLINRYLTPWQHNDLLHKLSSNYWKSRSLLNYLQKFTTDMIKLREQSYNLTDVDSKEINFNTRKRMAMLDLLLSAKLTDNSIDNKGIQEEVDTFMFEGHDTTATSITFSLMLLASHENIQNKVCDELKSILSGSRRDFAMEDLNEMKYLEMVVKESLRLYPSVPFIARTLSEDITTPSGYLIPKGTTLTLAIYYMQQDSRYYENPEKFDPDRFRLENSKGRHPYVYIPFSAGPRNCIGQKFAMLEMKAAIATILRNFKLHPISTPETTRLRSDIVLRSSKPILVKFQLRENDAF